MRLALKILLPVVLLGTAVAAFVFLRDTKPLLAAKTKYERTWAVSAVQAHYHSVQPPLVVFGEVVAGIRTQLRAEAPGTVAALGPNLREGGSIRRGELIIALDPTDLELSLRDARSKRDKAAADLALLRAELEGEARLEALARESLVLKQRQLERQEGLARSGTATERAVEDAAIRVAEAKDALARSRIRLSSGAARLDGANAVLEQAEVVVLEAERDLARAKLVAPHDGIALAVDTGLGRRTERGDVVARLIDVASMEVRFQLSDAQYARLLARRDVEEGAAGIRGVNAEVIWEVGGMEHRYVAEVDRVAPELRPERGGVQVYARLRDLDLETLLRPGAFVRVALRDRRFENVLRLPAEAVLPEGLIFSITADERLESHPAAVVHSLGDEVLVRSKVEQGRKVVTSRFPDMAPGAKVSPR